MAIHHLDDAALVVGIGSGSRSVVGRLHLPHGYEASHPPRYCKPILSRERALGAHIVLEADDWALLRACVMEQEADLGRVVGAGFFLEPPDTGGLARPYQIALDLCLASDDTFSLTLEATGLTVLGLKAVVQTKCLVLSGPECEEVSPYGMSSILPVRLPNVAQLANLVRAWEQAQGHP